MGNSKSKSSSSSEPQRDYQREAQQQYDYQRQMQELENKRQEDERNHQRQMQEIENKRKQDEDKRKHDREMKKLENEQKRKMEELETKRDEQAKKLQYEQERRMKELEERRQKQEQEANDRAAKKEYEHQQKLKELANKRREQELQHEKELKQMREQQKEKAIKKLNDRISELDTEIKNCQEQERDIKAQQNECQKDLNILRDDEKNFEPRMKEEISQWMQKNQYQKVKSDLQNAKDEITKAIEKTSLLESSVGKFLRLTQGLVYATTVNQINSTKLSATIKVFGETIDRESQYKLTMDTYLKDQGLKKIIPYLKEEEFETMEDLICDDDDEYKETLDIVNDKLKEEIDNWDKTSNEPKPKKLSKPQLRKFKRMCRKPETWQSKQIEQEELAKHSLGEVAPVLGEFFKRTYTTMQITDEILSIAPKLNSRQIEALEDMENYNIKRDNEILRIKHNNVKNTNENIKDEEIKENQEKETKKKENINEEDIDEEEEEEREIEDIIHENIDINNDFDINGLQLQKQLENSGNRDIIKQTELLSQAAIVSIDVVKSMENMFKGSETLDRALNLATSIESSCMNIVKAQSQIRQSLILANKIIELKPSNLRDTSKKLWNAVDNGIVNVYKNVLEMTKVSAQFFSFFLKFNQSLNYFLTGNKKNTSLVVSLQHLKKDVTDFSKFSVILEKQVGRLGDEAMKIIQSCIDTAGGSEAYENALQRRKIKQDEFDQLTKSLIEMQLNFDKKRDELYTKIFQKEAEKKNLKFVRKQTQENLLLYRNNKKRCNELVIEIQKMKN